MRCVALKLYHTHRACLTCFTTELPEMLLNVIGTGKAWVVVFGQ
jgi:hypothetical protein